MTMKCGRPIRNACICRQFGEALLTWMSATAWIGLVIVIALSLSLDISVEVGEVSAHFGIICVFVEDDNNWGTPLGWLYDWCYLLCLATVVALLSLSL